LGSTAFARAVRDRDEEPKAAFLLLQILALLWLAVAVPIVIEREERCLA
jgi:hypothetical protein